MKLHTEISMSAKFDNDISTFYVDNPDQKFFLYENLVGIIHTLSSLYSIWTSSWLDWKQFS